MRINTINGEMDLNPGDAIIIDELQFYTEVTGSGAIIKTITEDFITIDIMHYGKLTNAYLNLKFDKFHKRGN